MRKVIMLIVGGAMLIFLSLSTLVLAQEQITLRIVTHIFEPVNELNREVIKKYMSQHPNVRIEYMTVPFAQFRITLLTSFAGGTAPDIMHPDYPWISEFASKRLLDPAPPDVQRDVKENLIPIAESTASYEDIIYGYYPKAGTQMLFYNVDLVKEAGLDPDPSAMGVTWEEFVPIAKALTKTDAAGNVTQAGIVFRKGYELTSNFANFLWSNKGEFFTEDFKKVRVNESAGIEALQYMYDLYWKHKVGDPQFLEFFEAFTTAKAATTMFFSAGIARFKRANPDLNFHVALSPIGRGKPAAIVGAFVWTVASTSRYKETAWDFVKFRNNEEYMLKEALVTHFIPTRKSLWELPEIVNDKYFPQLAHVVEYARRRPGTVHWGEVREIIGRYLDRVIITNKLTPKDALDRAAKEVQALMER
ncbi:extracellular solute-binding protein [Patescibacteria group bacterium]|nr:extracellular solute-binding protein [Patescibacteria group bacterium]